MNNTGKARYSVRFVHQIAPVRAGDPSGKDLGPTVEISDGSFSNSRTLAKALRQASVLLPGAQVRQFRVEGDRVVVFPRVPGLTTYWHSVVLTKLPEIDLEVSGGGSVYLVRPVSPAGKDWVAENISEEAIWFGDSVAVEHRYIQAIVGGAREDGLEVI